MRGRTSTLRGGKPLSLPLLPPKPSHRHRLFPLGNHLGEDVGSSIDASSQNGLHFPGERATQAQAGTTPITSQVLCCSSLGIYSSHHVPTHQGLLLCNCWGGSVQIYSALAHPVPGPTCVDLSSFLVYSLLESLQRFLLGMKGGLQAFRKPLVREEPGPLIIFRLKVMNILLQFFFLKQMGKVSPLPHMPHLSHP